MTDHHKIARQAARDTIAIDFERRGLRGASDIRAGHSDCIPGVRDAILGALAAADALRPVIRAEVVRECAGVARGYSPPSDDLPASRDAALDAAEEIERAILALIQENPTP